MRFLSYLAWAALGLAVILILARVAQPAQFDGDDAMRLVYAVGVIALISGGVVGAIASKPGKALRDILIWGVLFLVVIGGYALRDDFALIAGRIGGELNPAAVQSGQNGAQSVQRQRDGHFYITAGVEGTPVLFLIDTGASLVSLSRADAQRAGIDVDRLNFSMPTMTAAGPSRSAPVYIQRLELGTIVLENVEASVMDRGEFSLLGMTALNRLSSVEVRGDRLVLQP